MYPDRSSRRTDLLKGHQTRPAEGSLRGDRINIEIDSLSLWINEDSLFNCLNVFTSIKTIIPILIRMFSLTVDQKNQ